MKEKKIRDRFKAKYNATNKFPVFVREVFSVKITRTTGCITVNNDCAFTKHVSNIMITALIYVPKTKQNSDTRGNRCAFRFIILRFDYRSNIVGLLSVS